MHLAGAERYIQDISAAEEQQANSRVTEAHLVSSAFYDRLTTLAGKLQVS